MVDFSACPLMDTRLEFRYSNRMALVIFLRFRSQLADSECKTIASMASVDRSITKTLNVIDFGAAELRFG